MNTYDLFESIDIIIQARLKALALDRTLVCEIINNDFGYQGKYTVSHENAHFVAESTDISFKIGDLVYVGVPTNNYNNAFIICKKIKNADTLASANPFNNFIELAAYTPDEELVWEYDNASAIQLPIKVYEQTISHLEPYTHLGISTIFNTLVNCPWGLIVYVITREFQGQDTTDELQAEIIKIINDNTLTVNEQETLINQKRQQYARDSYLKTSSYIWKSSDMSGNACNYQADFIQQTLIDISDLKNIEKIQLYIYAEDPNKIVELRMKQLELIFGYSMANYTEETLEIYTSNTLTYNTSSERQLYGKWIKMINGAPAAITYRDYTHQPSTTVIKWQEYGDNGWVDLDNNNTTLQQTVVLNPYRSQEQYRCIVQYTSLEASAPIELVSNVLTFSNISPNSANIIKDSTVKLTTDIVDFSSYYNVDGSIVDLSLANDIRNITLTASTQDLSKIEENIQLNIVWKIPKANSMLQYAGNMSNSAIDTDTYDVYIYTISNIKQNIASQQLISNFPFKIKNYNIPAYNNNLVICELQIVRNGIVVQTDIVDINFDFKRPNISSNDYTLVLNMYKNGEIIYALKSLDTATIKPKLYNSLGEEETIVGHIQYDWYSCPADNVVLTLKQYESNQTLCSVQSTVFNPTLLVDYTYWQNQCYIVKATYCLGDSKNGQQEVIGYLPIALNLSIDNLALAYLSGPIQVAYDNSGGNPLYYHGSYKLYQFNQNDNIYTTVSSIKFIDSNYKKADYNQNYYYPKLGTINNHTTLCPKSIFMEESNTGYCVLAVRENDEIPYWVQPILLYQTQAFSSFINEWSGQLEIGGQDANTAMMARLGAGKKNDDGTFSGILLGDWKKQIQNGAWKNWHKEHTGLYGYNHNLESYGFRDDGTAFLGKAGAGRINFNGDLGLIYSGNFDGSFYSVLSESQLKPDNYTLYDNYQNTSDDWDNPSIFNFGFTPFPLAVDQGYLESSNWKLERDSKDQSHFTFSGSVGKTSDTNTPQGTEYPAPYVLSVSIKPDKPLTPGVYIYEQIISTESQGYKNSAQKDVTSELCLDLSFHNDNCYLANGNNEKYQILSREYLDIGSHSGIQEGNIRLYSASKFHIKMQITIPSAEQEEYVYLHLPIFTLTGKTGKSGTISERAFKYDLSNISFYQVEAYTEEGSTLWHPTIFDISNIEANDGKNIKTAHSGQMGTFLNLKDGELITNNAVFRGSLQVENMELLNEIVIGDPTGANGASWIRITPDGRFLSSETSDSVKVYFSNDNYYSIYNSSNLFGHKDIVITMGDSTTSNYVHFVYDPGNGEQRAVYYTELNRYPENNY